jgi:hypothetical protein
VWQPTIKHLNAFKFEVDDLITVDCFHDYFSLFMVFLASNINMLFKVIGAHTSMVDVSRYRTVGRDTPVILSLFCIFWVDDGFLAQRPNS